jgi:hypothetical protein
LDNFRRFSLTFYQRIHNLTQHIHDKAAMVHRTAGQRPMRSGTSTNFPVSQSEQLFTTRKEQPLARGRERLDSKVMENSKKMENSAGSREFE